MYIFTSYLNAKKMKDLTNSVQEAIAGFLTLTTQNGWDTELAFECQYDLIYDEISKEEFLNAIQKTGNILNKN